jgi:uncharacterized protein (TIGR02594 family)
MKTEWREYLYKQIPSELVLGTIPKDYLDYVTWTNRVPLREFYTTLFVELARFESGFNPKATYKESFKDSKGKNVISTGLFQVSVESLRGYGVKVTQEELFDPYKNIDAMLAIAKKWIVNDGVIASDKAPWRGMARYFSPFRDAKKKETIAKATRKVGVMETASIYERFYETAKKEMGINELSGAKHNKRILEYHATTTLKAKSDEVPWCSSFVNWVVFKCSMEGTNSAAARSWMKWGKGLTKPVKGCIVVFTRTGGGHVGFYHSEDKGFIYVLGGNQSNSVNISAYAKSRLLGYRGV